MRWQEAEESSRLAGEQSASSSTTMDKRIQSFEGPLGPAPADSSRLALSGNGPHVAETV